MQSSKPQGGADWTRSHREILSQRRVALVTLVASKRSNYVSVDSFRYRHKSGFPGSMTTRSHGCRLRVAALPAAEHPIWTILFSAERRLAQYRPDQESHARRLRRVAIPGLRRPRSRVARSPRISACVIGCVAEIHQRQYCKRGPRSPGLPWSIARRDPRGRPTSPVRK